MNYVFFFILLFNFDILADGPPSNSTENIASQRLARRRSIISLMFANYTTAIKNVPTNRTATCRWLRGHKHQNKLCRKWKGFPETLIQARHLAVNQCEELFRFDRWNCSYKKSFFKKVFRETAFLHALGSSAIMYSVAKACSNGKLQNCRCAHQEEWVNPKHNWKWGGCGDNTKQARKITGKFLQLRHKGDGPHNVLNFNSLIGMKTVAESETKECKCHGVSASCFMKTCWKSLRPFNTVAENLKRSYHHAIQHSSRNTIQQTMEKINKSPGKLLYLTASPNFCLTTTGRRCKDIDNCATLCCGRGFVTRETIVYKQCRCRWQEYRFDVTCDTCSDMEDVHNCK